MPSSIYTSFADADRLGDTNADGSDTAPQASDWVGVNLCKLLCEYSTAGNIYYAEPTP
ncbi:MAG: hypothetical protein JW751_25885 [Polyangiaceae bacterium]|nr:hypothetical protein [Polyangiaceae bacterium]